MNQSILLLTFAGGLVALAGCTGESRLAERDMHRVVAPATPGGRVAAAHEYTETTETYRVFGVEHAGTDDARAVVANTRTWETRTVRAGDTLGRGYRIARVAEDGVELAGEAGDAPRLALGKDTKVREIAHRYDHAVRYAGRQRFEVDRADLADLSREVKAGFAVEHRSVFGEDALALVRVDPEGALARLGLEEGDIVFGVDEAKLGGLPAAVARGESTKLRVYRSTAIRELTYVAH